MAIARAEKAEQAAAEKIKDSIDEAEKRVQRAEESAVQLAQKFTDAMKRMEGSTSIGM
jgi:vacuolar-type H+-ATPase subunit H